MKRNALKKKVVHVLSVLVLLTAQAYADGEREHEKHKEKAVQSVHRTANAVHEEVCGSCHFAYQPWLLPSESWKGIMAGLEDHHGNALEMNDRQKKEIAEFLLANAADKSRNKRSGKIVKSLVGQAPLRVTEVPYIRKKHHDLSAEVLSRPSIAGLGNCSACHPGASQGLYDDDTVRVPPK